MSNYGSVCLRKDGRYYGRVQVEGNKFQLYGTDPEAVQLALNEFVLKHIESKDSKCFSSYILNYLTVYKFPCLKRSSYDRLESICKVHIVGSEIDIHVKRLDDTVIQSYLVKKSKILSKSSLKKLYDLIKMVLFYAYRKKDIDTDIGDFLYIPRQCKPVQPVQVYSKSDLYALHQGIEAKVYSDIYNDKRRYRYAFAYLVIYHTGLRAGELLALKKSDIDFDHMVIHVRSSLSHVRVRDEENADTKYIDQIEQPKTFNGFRDVPINTMCRDYLLFLMADYVDSDYLVHNLSGDVLKLRSFQQTFQRICADLGVPYYGLHALRHTFATNLIDAGADVHLVSRLLGHASVKTTYDRYVHVDTSGLADVVDMLTR